VDDLISGAGNEDIFFGCLTAPFDSASDLSGTAQRVYSGIFEFLQRGNYPNLLRVWNYFPDINAVEDGIERYRSFSVGRHEAFVRYDRKVEDSPSACALGSHGGPLSIYFLASRFRGVQIENPRQISAYKYPKQYGPRSPTFSRATLAFDGASQILFISGTASILGHVTVHPGSADLQTRETLANISAVIDQACKQGFKFAGFGNGMALKVYLRHAEHLRLVQDIIREEWGVLPEMIVLQADICRTDLLLEIEAVCWSSVD
jgi:enamine deaminase RidA (YjgF/YER057c/UK114 family)